MDQVQKPSDSECYTRTPSSDPIRFSMFLCPELKERIPVYPTLFATLFVKGIKSEVRMYSFRFPRVSSEIAEVNTFQKGGAQCLPLLFRIS
jgi:hypothetical protein